MASTTGVKVPGLELLPIRKVLFNLKGVISYDF